MKVVFLEDVEGTAQVGEVKEVKNGFARNFLLPRRLAAPAIEPYLRRAQAHAVREAKHQEVVDVEASTIAERIEGKRITFTARVGEQNKLYGSITSIHIAEEVAKLTGDEEFDHRKVLLPEAIKEVGIQPIRLRLTRNVEATIEVEVLAEGEDLDETEEAEAGEQPSAEAEEGPQAEVEEEATEAEETAEEPPAPDATELEAETEESEEEEEPA
ncbi:MAG: 50S ribosomal protein L9 [Chloroflexi bacterium]|nr:50S ribosomal protein L9 [Chloroflexota bacterium]